MVTKTGRKTTGGKYISQRKKKKLEIAGQKRIIKLGEEKRKNQRKMGGGQKTFLLRAKMINVIDKKNKTKKVEITRVLQTPSNIFLARQNVLTKGTIVETSLGKVRITNRPTQEGMINGVLIE